jgi:glycosyltransferase involved in cell wall biosynthesis
MVGRYNDAKGYDYIIPAWDIVHKIHPDWTLDVYGSGELHDDVVRWIKERHLEDSMILHDPTDQIMEKYLESSICVMSSRYEGFPMVLVESMASGVPCVAFDCPFGPRNIIKDGEDGLLIDYLNTQALAEGICKLIEDKELRSSMGCRARKNILRFSREHVMQQWVTLFESLYTKKVS